MAGIIERLDAQLDDLFRGWNWLTLVILALLLIFLVYPLVTARDPDTHPLLLSRQANVSPVRQPGESAVYRSLEVPHGYPLKTGLGVRDPSTPRYAAGKDGDLRHIWQRTVQGEPDNDDKPTGKTGKILTVRGVEQVKEHALSEITKEINVIGQYVKQKGAKYVAVYLPNSVELLVVLFAGAFYGFTPILLPYDKPKDVILQLLKKSDADSLVAAAGSLPSRDVHEECDKVKEVMWVVEETSRDVDWTDAAEGTSTWHELVEENTREGSSELPPIAADEQVPDIITLWLSESDPSPAELVSFTQRNMVAAVAAQISVLPRNNRINNSDLFMPADSMTSPAILVLTLAALYSNASIALNSVAGSDVPLQTIVQKISPTIIAATSSQAFQLHDSTASNIKSTSHQYALSAQRSALQSGLMPHAAPSLTSRLTSPITALLGTVPGKLRLLYVLDRTNSDSPPTSSRRLQDLRAFTGARIIHGLTTAKVAGTVVQTALFDYRAEEDETEPGHFGIPPACVEVLVRDRGDYRTTDERAQGELVVRGPAVQGGGTAIGVFGEFRDDGCLNYLFQHPEKSTKPDPM